MKSFTYAYYFFFYFYFLLFFIYFNFCADVIKYSFFFLYFGILTSQVFIRLGSVVQKILADL